MSLAGSQAQSILGALNAKSDIEKELGNIYNNTYFEYPMTRNVAVTQFALWISVFLFLVVFYAAFAMFYMDMDKESDTILYAKFLTKVEDRR